MTKTKHWVKAAYKLKVQDHPNSNINRNTNFKLGKISTSSLIKETQK